MPPLYIGYSTLVGGYDANMFAEDLNPGTGVTINDLTGSQMYVGNLELRYPLTGPEQLSRIKSRFLLTELNLFTDAGIA